MRRSPWQLQLEHSNQTYSKKTQKKQNKKTAYGLLPKKNDNEEGRVTRNEDDGSEMGEMIVFTPR